MNGSYLYIPINPESKTPVTRFGGWPIDPSHDNVFTLNEVENSEHNWWAIVAGKNRSLLVLDIDYYKMSEAEKARIESGWFGALDATKVVKTPSGGLHIYFYGDFSREDLPRTVEHVDLKGDVARGYVLSHPRSKYVPQNDNRPRDISLGMLTELPVFKEETPKSESENNRLSLDDLNDKMVTPCIKRAMDSDSEFANHLLESALHGTVAKIPIHRILNRSAYPEEENTSAPPFLHDKPSKTGTNFRVDEGGETFRCWRHDVTGNFYHLYGVREGFFECGDWTYEDVNLSAVKKHARKNGIVEDSDIITCETVKNNDFCPFDCGRSHPFHGLKL